MVGGYLLESMAAKLSAGAMFDCGGYCGMASLKSVSPCLAFSTTESRAN